MVTNKRVLGVIPARMGSTRLQKKAIVAIGGKPLVQRVWERAKEAKKVSRLIVATDSTEIGDIISRCGGEVVMTDEQIPSGTDRVAAVVEQLAEKNWDAVVNIQGDMPFIRAEVIDQATDFLLAHEKSFEMATIAVPIDSAEEFSSPDRVKVVLADNGRALYFSRSAIPFSRDGGRLSWEGTAVFGYRHIGLYVYTVLGLRKFTSAPASVLEQLERLEQLRALEMGLAIGVRVIDATFFEDFVEIDTAADLERAQTIVR